MVIKYKIKSKIELPIDKKTLEECEKKYFDVLSLLEKYGKTRDVKIKKEKALEFKQYLDYFKEYLRESGDPCILLIISDIENVLGQKESADRHYKTLNEFLAKEIVIPEDITETGEKRETISQARDRDIRNQLFGDLNQ